MDLILEDPWRLDHFRQLARVLVLKGDIAFLRAISGVLVYFDVADEGNTHQIAEHAQLAYYKYYV